jgi:hypothetical protein
VVATGERLLFSAVHAKPIFIEFPAHIDPAAQFMSRVCDALLDMHLLGSFAAGIMTVVDAAGAHT